MKRLIVLAICALPVLGFSQDQRGGAVPPAAKNLDYSNNSAVHVEVIMSSGAGRGMARIELGESYKQVITDKAEVAALENLKGLRYTNLPDALNALNSLGFEVVASYSIDNKTGGESHLVMSKSIRRTAGSASSGASGTKQKPTPQVATSKTKSRK